VISPFGYPAAEAPIQDGTLADFQREAVAACGLPPPTTTPGDGPTLVFNDDLLIGRRLLAEFVKRAQSVESGRAMLELEPCVFTREYAPLQQATTGPGGGPLLPVWWLADGGPPPDSTDGEGFEPIKLSVDEKVLKVPVPKHWFGKDELELPMTGKPAIRIRHWMHLLFANRIASSEQWLRAPAWLRILRIIWALVRAIVPTPARVLRRMSTFGKGCQIHPSAVIEASTLGPGVRVGANAVVKFSRLGEGCMVMDGANVSFSTLGPKCTVAVNCAVSFSLLHEAATAAQTNLQVTVLGKRVITTSLGLITDMKLGGGEVAVFDDGKVVSSGQRFLGGAIGDDVVLGTGIWIAHGREIPNGYVVVRSPDAILHKVPGDLPIGEPLGVIDGTLKPL
jgi:carbonic anhydrase/acetyltransferase-like protein (isoleucine patch superfamily)